MAGKKQALHFFCWLVVYFAPFTIQYRAPAQKSYEAINEHT